MREEKTEDSKERHCRVWYGMGWYGMGWDEVARIQCC